MEAWEEIEEIEADLEAGRITQEDASFLIQAISEDFCSQLDF